MFRVEIGQFQILEVQGSVIICQILRVKRQFGLLHSSHLTTKIRCKASRNAPNHMVHHGSFFHVYPQLHHHCSRRLWSWSRGSSPLQQLAHREDSLIHMQLRTGKGCHKGQRWCESNFCWCFFKVDSLAVLDHPQNSQFWKQQACGYRGCIQWIEISFE